WARSPISAARSRRAPEKSCIFIVQYGGASHIDTLDPKPNAPQEIRGPYRPIATAVPGIRFAELIPRMARLADRCCIVRSMTHRTADHDAGMHVCMTGHSSPAENTPYFGCVVAKLRPATRNIPSYVWLQNLDRDVQPRYLTGGYLGAAYAPLRICTNLDNPATPGFRVSVFDPPAEVSPARVQERERLLQQLQGGQPAGTAAPPLQRFHERAVDLVTSAEARRAFNLELEPAALRG